MLRYAMWCAGVLVAVGVSGDARALVQSDSAAPNGVRVTSIRSACEPIESRCGSNGEHVCVGGADGANACVPDADAPPRTLQMPNESVPVVAATVRVGRDTITIGTDANGRWACVITDCRVLLDSMDFHIASHDAACGELVYVHTGVCWDAVASLRAARDEAQQCVAAATFDVQTCRDAEASRLRADRALADRLVWAARELETPPPVSFGLHIMQ